MKMSQLAWVGITLATVTSGSRGDEERVVKALESLGCDFKRDENRPGKPVIEARLLSQYITDADLKGLPELRNLRSLVIGSGEITDAGLKGLAKLTQLK